MSQNSLVQQLIKALNDKKQKVSFAESCTGGQLASQLTEIPGVSSVYNGSIVTYSNESKIQFLGVSSESLKNFGAVSDTVAQQMALGVKERFQTDWGISLTGVAGPTGGTPEKPVGTVWIAVAGKSVAVTDVVAQKFLFHGDRKQIQFQATQAALSLLLQNLGIGFKSEF